MDSIPACTASAQDNVPTNILPIVTDWMKKPEEPERDEAFIRERLEIFRAYVVNNLSRGYTQMPDQVRTDPFLSPAAKTVYEHLLSFMWSDDLYCWPSQVNMAKALGKGCSRSTIIRALQELCNRGYIEKLRRGLGYTNFYFINPLSFVSFKQPGRGHGHLLQVNAPERQINVFHLPPHDVLSGMFQIGTPESRNVEQTEVVNCDTIRIQANQPPGDLPLKGEAIRTGSAGPGEMRVPPSPSVNLRRAAIGNKQDANNGKTNNIKQNETSNDPNVQGIAAAAKNVKRVEEENSGKKLTNLEQMALKLDLLEQLKAMQAWLLENPKRPDITPETLTNKIGLWTERLDEIRLKESNITRGSKIYKYARTQGLSQATTENCFDRGREALRIREQKGATIQNKMQYVFSSIMIDILLALQEHWEVPALPGQLPDGYDKEGGMSGEEEYELPLTEEEPLELADQLPAPVQNMSEPALFVHPVYSHLRFNNLEHPTAMVVELVPDEHPHWDELNYKYRTRTAEAVAYDLSQKGCTVSVEFVYKAPEQMVEAVSEPPTGETEHGTDTFVSKRTQESIPAEPDLEFQTDDPALGWVYKSAENWARELAEHFGSASSVEIIPTLCPERYGVLRIDRITHEKHEYLTFAQVRKHLTGKG